MWAEQSSGATWDLPAITMVSDTLDGRGPQPTELLPEQGPMNEVPTAPRSAWVGGRPVWRCGRNLPTPSFMQRPEDSVASLIHPYWAKAPSEVRSRGPALAWLTHSFGDLILNELLTTKKKKCKGFSKKCNFHLRSKILPKTRHHLFILSVPQREREIKGIQH